MQASKPRQAEAVSVARKAAAAAAARIQRVNASKGDQVKIYKGEEEGNTDERLRGRLGLAKIGTVKRYGAGRVAVRFGALLPS